MIDLLFTQPIVLIPVLAAIIMAFTVHEFSHALAAELQGDETPKSLGRLTLNPMAHIDWLGFILLITAGFGWGRPVPFNPRNLKNTKWGSALVGAAGPISNLLMAIVAAIVLAFVTKFTLLGVNNLLVIFLGVLVQFNLVLMIFNLIPIPPLDGSKVLFALLPDRMDDLKRNLTIYGPIFLILLILFGRNILAGLFGFVFNLFLVGFDKLIF
jgi:Zn-dependent protease